MTPLRLPRNTLVACTAVTVGIAGCSAWKPTGPSASFHQPTVLSAGNMGDEAPEIVVRGQGQLGSLDRQANSLAPGSSDHYRFPMAVSGSESAWSNDTGQSRSEYSRQLSPPGVSRTLPAPGSAEFSGRREVVRPGAFNTYAGPESPDNLPPLDPGYPPNVPGYGLPEGPTPTTGPIGLPNRLADVIVNVQETQTGRIMLGAGINSDAGVTGQIVIDERNFDWRRFPTSFDDIGTAFRGAGQGFRLEALPGRIVQRYLMQFTEPYVGGTRISMSLSAYLYERRYFDWDEERVGGRMSMGYRLTPDLSVSVGVRGEQVELSRFRANNVPELNAAQGENELYTGRVSVIHDTRDIPFAPTEGHLVELSYTQAFGDFDYPRGDIDYRRYLLLMERPDGSGRHVFSYSMRLGFTGSDTPIFENYFAGGHSTIRGFDFRGATPMVGDIAVGGEFLMLGSLEYTFPITADDMLKGVVFCDYGTVEEDIEINSEDFRVALGAGLRIFIPAMGPAPIALDFAVPVTREDSDRIENFSFFIGVGR